MATSNRIKKVEKEKSPEHWAWGAPRLIRDAKDAPNYNNFIAGTVIRRIANHAA